MDNKEQAIAEILSLIKSKSATTDDGVFTFSELFEVCGIGELKLRKTLRELIAEGVIECLWSFRTNIAGVYTRRICYRLVTKAQDNAAAQSLGTSDQTS